MDENKENYLKRSDEKLGGMVRDIAKRLKDKDGFSSSVFITGCHLLISSLIDLNATENTFDIDGFTDKGIECGDWKIIIKKKD